jgi:hypothetical protein
VEKTITVRIDSRKDKALARRARAYGKTKSDVVRELIDVREILTLDRRGFRTYRTLKRQSFQLLLD